MWEVGGGTLYVFYNDATWHNHALTKEYSKNIQKNHVRYHLSSADISIFHQKLEIFLSRVIKFVIILAFIEFLKISLFNVMKSAVLTTLGLLEITLFLK